MENTIGATLVGHGVVTKWSPEDLARKESFEREVIKDGVGGSDLEREALRWVSEQGIGYETTDSYNSLVNGGTNIMLQALSTAGGAPVYYTNALAALGVGDSNTGLLLTQTNLQGVSNNTNRVRVAMNATYPSLATNVLTFQSTFATGIANWQWNEWAIFNNVTDGSGTMLNRSVAVLGTKTSASAWQLTVTLTLS